MGVFLQITRNVPLEHDPNMFRCRASARKGAAADKSKIPVSRIPAAARFIVLVSLGSHFGTMQGTTATDAPGKCKQMQVIA